MRRRNDDDTVYRDSIITVSFFDRVGEMVTWLLQGLGHIYMIVLSSCCSMTSSHISVGGSTLSGSASSSLNAPTPKFVPGLRQFKKLMYFICIIKISTPLSLRSIIVIAIKRTTRDGTRNCQYY